MGIFRSKEQKLEKTLSNLKELKKERDGIKRKLGTKRVISMQRDSPVNTIMGGWGVDKLEKRYGALGRKIERKERKARRLGYPGRSSYSK